jgi:hypothetical protein
MRAHVRLLVRNPSSEASSAFTVAAVLSGESKNADGGYCYSYGVHVHPIQQALENVDSARYGHQWLHPEGLPGAVR